jgi:hypothetical protein
MVARIVIVEGGFPGSRRWIRSSCLPAGVHGNRVSRVCSTQAAAATTAANDGGRRAGAAIVHTVFLEHSQIFKYSACHNSISWGSNLNTQQQAREEVRVLRTNSHPSRKQQDRRPIN